MQTMIDASKLKFAYVSENGDYTFALNGDASSVPVLLRIGGRIAARGRLVDVGGMPGVQITGMADAAGGSAEESANPESRAEGN